RSAGSRPLSEHLHSTGSEPIMRIVSSIFFAHPVSPEVNRGSMGADAGGHSGVGHRPVEDEHGGPGTGDDSRQPVSAQRIDQGHRLRVDAAAELLMELVTGGFEER